MWPYAVNNEPCSSARLISVLDLIEVAWGQVLGSRKGKFTVASQSPRGSHQLVDIAGQVGRQSTPLSLQDVPYIVHARRVDAHSAEQTLQGKFNDLLRFTNHVGPATCLIQDIDRMQASRGAHHMVGSESSIPHLSGLLPVRMSVRNTPYQVSGRNGAPHTRQSGRQLPIAVDQHHPIQRDLSPEAAKLSVVRHMHEVRVQTAATPRDDWRQIPCAIQGSIQCNTGVHNDEGIDIGCMSGLATHPRTMKDDCRKRITNHLVGASDEGDGVLVTHNTKAHRRKLPNAVSVEREAAGARGIL